jgi:CheY-like chemotaxis protein
VSGVILICDDEPGLRALMCAALAPEGYEIHEACDGEELLALARSVRADVVVLDLTLPGISGLEALAELRADAALRQPRVILASAWAGAAEQGTAEAVGVDRFLAKPFRLAALRVAVRELAEAST